MERSDYILISRNNVLYKAPIAALSTVIGFDTQKEADESKLLSLSSYIEDSVKQFSDTHYSKSDMKTDFCTISSVNGLTSDATYALTSLATSKIKSLSSKTNVDDWYLRQLRACARVFEWEFGNIKSIMKASPPTSGGMEDYAIPPDVEDIMKAIDKNVDIDSDYT